MKNLIPICMAVALLAAPAHAEDETGPSLMEQGAELFFKGLRQEMEPTLQDFLDLAEQFGPAMQSFLAEMGPALAELAADIQDWSVYEMPEVLPNGDIIIRKKPQPPEAAPEQPEIAPEGEIEI